MAEIASAGGGDLASLEDVGVVAYELGRRIAPVPYIETSVLPACLLRASAPGSLRDELLARVGVGERFAAAVQGPGATGRCSFIRGRRLQGSASLVRTGGSGSLLQVATDERGASFLCVVDLDGVPTRPRSSIARLPMIDVEYRDTSPSAAVPLIDTTGALGATFAVTAAWWAGATRALVDMTAAYAKERKQFGQPIGAFQAIQHRLADMVVDAEAARLVAFRACAAAAVERVAERDALEAWMIAGEAARRSAASAHQIFGGYGFTIDFDVHLFSRAVRGMQFWITDPFAVQQRLGELLHGDALAGVTPG